MKIMIVLQPLRIFVKALRYPFLEVVNVKKEMKKIAKL